MTKVYLTRHGQTIWNLENRIQGWKDAPLSELGIKQAHWLKDRLKGTEIDIIYSSPLKRAYDTSLIVKGTRKIDVVVDEALKEMNMGSWEGHLFEDIKKKYPREYIEYWKNPHLYKPNRGESYDDLWHRVLPAFQKIAALNENKSILVVTHTVTLKIILAYYENRQLEKLWDFPYIHETSLSYLEISGHETKIHYQGDITHYQEDLDKSVYDRFDE